MILPFALLAFLQILDIGLHVATGQVEPIRIAGSVVLIFGAVMGLARPAEGTILIGLAAVLYLAVTILFLVQNGVVNPNSGALRIPLFAFVFGSLLLSDWLRRRLMQS